MTNTGIRLFGIAWWRSHKNIFIKVAMKECIVDVQLKKMPMASYSYYNNTSNSKEFSNRSKVS